MGKKLRQGALEKDSRNIFGKNTAQRVSYLHIYIQLYTYIVNIRFNPEISILYTLGPSAKKLSLPRLSFSTFYIQHSYFVAPILQSLFRYILLVYNRNFLHLTGYCHLYISAATVTFSPRGVLRATCLYDTILVQLRITP